MSKLWRFISNPKNLAVLTALGAVVAFLWTQVIAPARDATPPRPSASQKASAPGGTAINATGDAHVSVGEPLASEPTPAPDTPAAAEPVDESALQDAPEQSADAGTDGTAINASGAARVNVNGRPKNKK